MISQSALLGICSILPPIGGDSPKNESFSRFPHPVNSSSHFVSLRNCTESTGTGAYPGIPTVNCSISANLRSRLQKPHSIDCSLSLLNLYRAGTNRYRPVPTGTDRCLHPIYASCMQSNPVARAARLTSITQRKNLLPMDLDQNR